MESSIAEGAQMLRCRRDVQFSGVGETFSSQKKENQNKQQQTLQRNTTGVLPGKSFVAKKGMLSGSGGRSLMRTQRLMRASATRDHST